MPKPSAPHTVSIRDVAERAGVSLGSASRVINNAANVTESTRSRVLAAVQALGYRPNHAAQSLRRQRTHTIGCLLTDVTNPLYGQLFHELEERLRRAGYVTLLANSLGSAEREVEILSTFRSRGMDGIVIAPGNERAPSVLAAVRALDIPTVILDRDMAPDRDRVQFSHADGMRAVVSHLGERGHRRMALVVSEAANRPMQRRVEGFVSGLRRQGLEPIDGFIVRLPRAMSSSYTAVSQLLQRRDRPTALIALGTNILNEALNAIAAQRMRIPDDISVVSLGDPDFARNFTPPLSALRVDLGDVAERAVAMMLGRLGNPGAMLPPHTVQVDSDFIIRGSCGPAPLQR